MTKTLLIAALALGTAALPATASAQQRHTLEYRDLDLGTAAGKAQMDRRIAKITREICTAQRRPGDGILAQNRMNTCRADLRRKLDVTVAQAAAKRGAAQLALGEKP